MDDDRTGGVDRVGDRGRGVALIAVIAVAFGVWQSGGVPVQVLVIDFGTSNTVAVLAGPGRGPRVLSVDGGPWMPSAVFLDGGAGNDAIGDGGIGDGGIGDCGIGDCGIGDCGIGDGGPDAGGTGDGGCALVVGRDAERKARLAPERFEPTPKRRIDEGEILLGARAVPVVDAIAAVLRRVGREARRQLNGRDPDLVRLTHPAWWGAARRAVLQAAARAAGLGGAVDLVPEPVGAAAHFAGPAGGVSGAAPGSGALPVGSALAVYDLGGGTFDCAVVGWARSGLTVLAEAGLPDVGGVDFDQVIVDLVGRSAAAADPGRWQSLTHPMTAAERRAARSLRDDARAAKEMLSRYPRAEIPLPDPFPDAEVTRQAFEAAIRPPLMRTVELLAATVRRAGLSAPDLAGVYLVGGSSRIPLVAALISEHLGVAATTFDQPETAVALGAALGVGTVGRPAPAPPHPAPVPVSVPHRPASAAPVVRPRRRRAPWRAVAALAAAAVVAVVAAVVVPRVTDTAGDPIAAPGGGATASASRVGSGSATGGDVGRDASRDSPSTASSVQTVPSTGTAPASPCSGSSSHGPSSRGPSLGEPSPPSGPSTSGSPSGSGSGTAPPTCASAPLDAQGMTPCLADLASGVQRLSLHCTPSTGDELQLPTGGSAVAVPQAVTSCFGLDGGTMTATYIQYGSVDQARAAYAAVITHLALEDQAWNGGRGPGRYAARTHDGAPELYWSYSSVPVVGWLQTGQDMTTQAELVRYWKGSVVGAAS